MATFVMFHEAMNNIGIGNIDLDTHTFNAALSNTAPSQANDDELADITQIANGNGYTTGGVALTGVAFSETGAGTGIWKWTSNDFSWTASGGSIATFRYIVIYSDTSTGDKLMGYFDYGAAVNITVGNSFTVDVQTAGLIQFTVA